MCRYNGFNIAFHYFDLDNFNCNYHYNNINNARNIDNFYRDYQRHHNDRLCHES